MSAAHGRRQRQRAAVFLWFESEAAAAADVYAATFPESAIEAVSHVPDRLAAGSPGAVQLVEMTICGLSCVPLNGGPPRAPPNDTYSLRVCTDDQAETDRF